MKRLFLSALILTVAITTGQAQGSAASDKEAVRQAALNYIDALYQAKPELIEKSVHPDLAKRGYFKKQGETTFSSSPMSYKQLLDLAGTWNKDGKRQVATAPREVVVYEVLNQTASAKVIVSWGIDYMHLAKYDGTWKIVNILWQEPPPK